MIDSLLIITGGMGAGKSSVLAEASDILWLRHLPHAAIDLDMLGLGCLPSGAETHEVMYENLRSVSRNYAAAGVRRFLVARSFEDRAQLDLCRKIFSARDTIVCRVSASLGVMQSRVQSRESGISSQEYFDRVTKLSEILDRARLEDFTVVNENRHITDVTSEMLVRAGWISAAPNAPDD
jgi:hypothetical protein